MFTNMRSNDAFLGLPHDIFTFTMLQEILARSLSVELGTYKHSVGSLHLYAKNIEGAKKYLDEGWQSTVSMPAMPMGNPWPSIKSLLKAESTIRNGNGVEADDFKLDPYWADFVRLLQIFRHSKDQETREIAGLKRRMSSHIYNTYIAKRQTKKLIERPIPEQLNLPVEK